jgi:hypothetical protein
VIYFNEVLIELNLVLSLVYANLASSGAAGLWHETFRRSDNVWKPLASRVDGNRRRDPKRTHRLYDRRSDSAGYRDHGLPVLATGARTGLCSELRDALVGQWDSDRVDYSEAAIAAFRNRGVCANGDRRHRDQLAKLATFEAGANL